MTDEEYNIVKWVTNSKKRIQYAAALWLAEYILELYIRNKKTDRYESLKYTSLCFDAIKQYIGYPTKINADKVRGARMYLYPRRHQEDIVISTCISVMIDIATSIVNAKRVTRGYNLWEAVVGSYELGDKVKSDVLSYIRQQKEKETK